MIENNTLGIIFSDMHDTRLGDLTELRTTGSVPIGGRYRFVDFVLSNMVNSGINTVGVVTKSNYQSLIDHLGSGREWDLARKNGGLHILPPYGRSTNGIYRGRMEALANILGYIRPSKAKYVVMSDCDVIANIDYADVIKKHRESGREMTLLYKMRDASKENDENTIIFTADDNGNVTDMRKSSGADQNVKVFMNIVVVNKDFLENLIVSCSQRNLYSFRNDVLLGSMIAKEQINTYEFKGYSAQIHSVLSYYNTNMDMLKKDVRDDLFCRERPIYTKVRDQSPAMYGLGSDVKNSLVADGCFIKGKVENCIIFRGVHIGADAVVKNSIIMQGTHIGEGCDLDCVITDKNVTVSDGKKLTGAENYPVYVKKGSKI